ncbi:hypothetical protein GCM10023116_42660 [Kistimonas scapharcae]|uniref:Uncharacterized protein n=1 Tax=Kistimonas scapharcae TaxID=1036133 RepID=A0ABP8V855_9GAMM
MAASTTPERISLNRSLEDVSNNPPSNPPSTFANYKAKREEDARAYYHEFYEWNGRNCCRGTWKCLRDFFIYPIVRAATFVLGCTLLLPYSIYLAATRQRQTLNMQQSDITRQFLNATPEPGSPEYIWQLRIIAQQINEAEKSEFRRCLDVTCPLLWPLTGVCLLVDKVDAWFHGRIRPEEVYLHKQTTPTTQRERELFGLPDENRADEAGEQLPNLACRSTTTQR